MTQGISADKVNYIYNLQLDAFTLYHISNDTSGRSSAIGPALPALGHAISGAAGTAISKLVTYPLDLVVTRLQVQRQLRHDGKHVCYDGVADAIEAIYEREGGLGAFYSGVVHETAKGIADSFLFFLAYSYLRQKRLYSKGNGKSLPALEELGVGAVAGAFSKFWTTPLQQIVTRKQTAAMFQDVSLTRTPPSSSTRDIALDIRREKGLLGFWSGYSASLILTLNPSITMFLHKILLRLLVPRDKQKDPGPRATFLLAAISKVLASTVTYPFSLAKTRAQVSSQKPTAVAGETSESEKLEETTKSKTARARQQTVFSTILRIVQTEGLLALYQGLGGEVMKGFFSHGITMLMKDRIHTVIIKLYYMVLKSLKQYPSPQELATQASEGLKDTYGKSAQQVGDGYSKAAQVGSQTMTTAKHVVSDASRQTQQALQSVKAQAVETYAQGTKVGQSALARAAEGVQDALPLDYVARMLEQGREAAGQAGQQGSADRSEGHGE